MKSINSNGILQDVFNSDLQDKQIIRNWLLDGAPTTNETFKQKDINIISHHAFKFQY
jgi:hypothetical protein